MCDVASDVIKALSKGDLLKTRRPQIAQRSVKQALESEQKRLLTVGVLDGRTKTNDGSE